MLHSIDKNRFYQISGNLKIFQQSGNDFGQNILRQIHSPEKNAITQPRQPTLGAKPQNYSMP